MKLAQPVCLTPHSRSICFVPPLTGLRSASPVLPQHIIHDPNSFPAKLYSTCDMRLCLPARMGGGEKTGIDALARASVHSPPHGGVYFRFREREGKALGVPASHRNRGDQPTITATRPTTAPSQQRDADGRCGGKRSGGKAVVPKGAAPPVPSESAPVARPARKEASVPCGSAKEHRALRSAAGKSASLDSPAHFHTLLIVTRMGGDYRPGARKQIEQVARQGSPSCYIRQIGRTISGIRGAVLPEFCLKTSRKGRNSCIVGER